MKSSAFHKFKSRLTAFWPLVLLVTATIGFVLFAILKTATVRNFDKAIFAKQDFGAFQKYAQKNGVEKAYEILKKNYPNNETQAHDFAHVVGLVALDQEGTKGLNACDTAFNYGCYHGLIEGFLIKNGIETVGEIEQACFDLGYIHTPSCLHGIGHGLMINATYKLEPALADCDRLRQSSRIYCWDGVFMERITGSMQDPQNRPTLTEDNLDEPCETISSTYKNQCWRNQVTVWLNYYQKNTQGVVARCFQIENQYQETCFESIGLTNVQNAGENIQNLINSCLSPNNQLLDPCLIGEMKELLFEGKSPQLAQSLCNQVSSQNQKECQQTYSQHFLEYQQRFGR